MAKMTTRTALAKAKKMFGADAFVRLDRRALTGEAAKAATAAAKKWKAARTSKLTLDEREEWRKLSAHYYRFRATVGIVTTVAGIPMNLVKAQADTFEECFAKLESDPNR